jgi:uncharacterized membrane protein YbhN (UPF0104 family)
LTALGLLVALLAVRALRGTILRWLARLGVPRSPLAARLWGYCLRLLGAVLDGIAGVDRSRLMPVLAMTVAVWCLSVVTIWFMFLAFGLPAAWQMALVLMLALTFSNLVPTPPALIGVVGAVAVAVCVPFGVSRLEALSLGTLLNVVMVAPPVLLGGAAAGERLFRLFAPGERRSLRRLLGLAPGGGRRRA